MIALLHLQTVLLLLCTVLPLSIRSNIIVVSRCSDGVIIGSDSLSVSGALVGNRVSECVYRLGENTVICCASGQSDFRHLLADLRSFIRSADSSHSGPVKTSSIARFARRLATQKYRNTHLIIAGSDGRDSARDSSDGDARDGGSTVGADTADGENSSADGARGHGATEAAVNSDGNIAVIDSNVSDEDIYSVHEVLSGGTLVSQSFALAGSGSDCVVTLMDDLFPSQGEGGDERGGGGGGTGTLTSLPSIESSVGRIRRVLRASVGFDPRTGSHLRVWSFDKKGLNLI